MRLLKSGRRETRFPLLCFCLLCLVLPLCLPRAAGAADSAAPWNRKFKPVISRERALQLVHKYRGDEVRSFHLLNTGLVRIGEDHSAGEWRFFFKDKGRGDVKEIAVAFHRDKPNNGVRVYRMAMER